MLLSKNEKDLDQLSERGSALVEFLVVGLPLLIPALIFFSAIHQVGGDRAKVTMIARQSLQAFVTARDDVEGNLRVAYLLERYSSMVGEKSRISAGSDWRSLSARGSSGTISKSDFSYSLRCQSIPCIRPGSRVELVLYRGVSVDSRVVIATVRSYVSKWHD